MDHRTVQHVSLPQPRNLTRSDESVRDAAIGQNRRKPLGQYETVAKDPISTGRWWRCHWVPIVRGSAQAGALLRLDVASTGGVP